MSDETNTNGLPQPGEPWPFFANMDRALLLAGLMARQIANAEWYVSGTIIRTDENGKQSRSTS